MWRRGCFASRLLSGLTLASFSLGCTTWKRPHLTPEQILATKRPTHVRVVRPDESKLEIWRPRITNDSLVGTLGRADSTKLGGVALADIKELQVRGVSAGKTVLLVTGLGITALIIAAATYDGPFGNGGGTTDSMYSCPVVYSWDGQQWRLDSGTFGGAIMPALSRTDVDNLLHATAVNDTLRLRVANKSRETDHLDYLAVLAVDHSPGAMVAPDREGRLQSVGRLESPVRAVDFQQKDVLARVTGADGWAWESAPAGRDSSRAEDVRDGIVLSFRRPPGSSTARLLVDASNSPWAEYMMGRFVMLHGRSTDAWYDSVAADPQLMRRIGQMMAREVYLGVSVKVRGGWERQNLVREAGPEISKQQIVPLDLSRVTGDSVTIRLESAPSLWLVDRVAIDYSTSEEFAVQQVALGTAVDHGGRNILPLLEATDEQEYVMERGDQAELTFAVPPVSSGRERSYLLVSRGWYRLDVPSDGAPQVAVLQSALDEPLGASRLITGDLGRAIQALEKD